MGRWKHSAVTEARKAAFCRGQGVASSVLGGRRQICSAPDSSARMKPCHVLAWLEDKACKKL